jgi:hypothetical protein
MLYCNVDDDNTTSPKTKEGDYICQTCGYVFTPPNSITAAEQQTAKKSKEAISPKINTNDKNNQPWNEAIEFPDEAKGYKKQTASLVTVILIYISKI